MSFPLLHQKLDGSDLLVFFDFEGTEFSHTAIALGLVAYKKDPSSLLPFSKKPDFTYSSLIKNKEPIGKVVEEITGISSFQLQREGKDYKEVVKEVSNLLRPYHKKYLHYGPLDQKILSHTTDAEEETEVNFLRHVKKNALDFYLYLEERLLDENGKPYGIARLGDKFSLSFEGKQHNPLYDALALSQVYFYIVSHEEELLKEYEKNYLINPFTEKLNKKIAETVLEKKAFTLEDFRYMLKENL